MKRMLMVLAAGMLAGALGNHAFAAATLTISDGVNTPISIVDNGAGDGSGSLGVITAFTNIGVWSLTLDTAVTKPSIGSATSPVLNLLITGQSTGAGTLTVTFSDNNFGPVSSSGTATVAAFVFGAGPPSTITYDVYGDAGNTVGATTSLITGIGPTLTPINTTSVGSISLSAPSSLTQVVTANSSGATTIDITASYVVPEPGTIALGTLGLAAFAFRKRFGSRA